MSSEKGLIKILIVDDTEEYSYMVKKSLEDTNPGSPYWDQIIASWKNDEFDAKLLKTHELQQFRKNKFEVKTLNNPQDSITYLTTEQPDFIIIDYHMPQMTGMELFSLLNDVFLARKEKDKNFKIPTRIILSSNTDGQLVLNLAKKGVDYYVEKGKQEVLYLLSIMATGFYYEPDKDEVA
jgi:CheY-like chemotaxis protein